MKSLKDTDYLIGNDYKHPVEDNQISPEGPDGRGPVLKKKATPITSTASASKEN
jgi:hypothetical protein